MEDDSSAVVNVTERMPGYTGRDGDSLRVSSGKRSTDFGRDARSDAKVPTSSSFLSSKDVLEFHKHKRHPQESTERGSIRAVDVLRRSFEDQEKLERGFEIELEEERMQCGVKPNLERNLERNLEDPELSDPDGNLNVNLKKGEELKEHVYCTVYCIANDNYRIPVDKASDVETTSQSPSSSSDGLLSPPTDSGHEPYPVPYTVSDLVSGLNNTYNTNSSFSAVLTCRICLDDRHIMPLHCCKKAVCEECLRRYISSQVIILLLSRVVSEAPPIPVYQWIDAH